MKKINLSDVCEISAGQSAPQKAEYFSKDGCPFVRAGSLEKLIAGNEELEHINDSIGKKLRLRLFPQNTILFAKSGMSAKIGRVFTLQISSFVVSHLAAIIPDLKKIEPNWLKRWFEFNPPSRLIPNDAYPSIKLSEIARLKIPVVALEKQKQVSTVLDTADTLRQKRKEQLNLLDDYLKSVFLEMFGDPIHNVKKWNFCEVHNLCSKIIDCPHSTPKYTDVITDYPCIRSSDLQDGFIDYTTTKYVNYSVYQDRTQRCVPGEGDVIYCREGARYGSSGYLPSGVKACLGQRTMMFRAKPDKVTPEFLWGLISSDSIYFQAKQMAGGAASPHINVKDIKKYKAFIPPIELQNKFTNIFKLIRITKQKMRASLDEMDNHFNALMQRYFG